MFQSPLASPDQSRLPCRQPLISWGLSALLLSSGAIATTVLLATPPAAQAYTARVSLFVYRDSGEPYENFLRRAEAISRAGVQRSLDADLLTTEVIVTVVGENQGISVPIMDVQVTRNQWRDRPDPQYWATYYESASLLLGFF
ncbi:hypothetical protein [Leptolyngbya sp. PCC 6406]|uniref:hypothetical protein n=1 Tax=Leptolyngbya sp. PCC 6406 TaxID=1173264 RepID=UPI0002AC3375|nr:hypothetical protein [Leptolyngbya sp. PCC 6406]